MSEDGIVAKNLPEFLTAVMELTKRWFSNEKNWGPWFRGHGDARWKLTPKLYRDNPPARGIRVVEDELRQEFVMRAPSLSDERPQNSWEWYFLMQHSGAPTRLLDWTESALIALYFAVRDKQDEGDGAVWVLDPWWLNKVVVDIGEVIPPGAEAGLFEKDSERYRDWLPDRYEVPGPLKVALPAAVYPTHFAKRISSQRSCFTIHGSRPDGFDGLPSGAEARLKKLIVPGSCAKEMEDSLSIAGIDEVAAFPDLDGLGRSLAQTLRDEARD